MSTAPTTVLTVSAPVGTVAAAVPGVTGRTEAFITLTQIE